MQRNTDACNNRDESHRHYVSEVRQTHKNNYSMILCIRNSRTHKTAHNNRIQVYLILEDGISGESDSKWAQKNFLEGWKCALLIGMVVRCTLLSKI